METPTQNITEVNQEALLRQYMQEKRRKRKKFMMTGLGVIVALALGYGTWQYRDLFRAAITETGTPAGTASVYIPEYQAGAGDEGLIALKAREDLGDLHSLQFTLKFNPVDALLFNENSIIFDADTAFQSADLKSVNTATPGQAVFSFFSNKAVAVAKDKTVVKLALKIKADLPGGTKVAITTSDVEAVVPDVNQLFKASATITAIDAGSITIGAKNNLKILVAESLDSTHVLVKFSDLLASIGEPGDQNQKKPGYTIINSQFASLTVLGVERGDARGYGQDTVLLTTASQTPGTIYQVLVYTPENANIAGNTQGKLNYNYRVGLFVTGGVAMGALSDFGMSKAEAKSPRTLEITFSDPVAAASITPKNFSVQNLADGSMLNVTNAQTVGSLVTLTVNSNLLQRFTYLVSVPNKAAADSPQREKDGVKLGIDQAAFSGFTNGPRVLSAAFVPNPQDPLKPFIEVLFSEPIAAGPLGALGSLHKTGTLTGKEFSVDTPGITLSGNKLQIADFASDPNTNYTFVANPGVTVGGVPLDSSHNSVTFWGAGHDMALTTVGAAAVVKRNVIEVEAGSLDFSAVKIDNLKLIYYFSPVTVKPDPGDPDLIQSVSVEGGKLRVITKAPLDFVNHYILHFTKPGDPMITLQTAEVNVKNDFSVLGATALGPKEVSVTFSENVDQGTVTAQAFILKPALNVASVSVLPSFKEVRLTFVDPLNPGTIYALTAKDVFSFEGGKSLSLNTAVFAGYKTQADLSAVRAESIKVNSGTEIEVTFSGDVDPATVTPVNMNILDPIKNTLLTIAGVKAVDAKKFVLTVALQNPEIQYFFFPFDLKLGAGIRDKDGKALASQRVLSFFGFSLPESTVSAITPSSVENDVDHDIVLSGRNLNNIKTVRVGNSEMKIKDQPLSGLSLTFVLPAKFPAGTVSLTFINLVSKSQTQANAILVTEPKQPLRVISESSLATPFRVPNDGKTKTTLKVLVEDPLDIGSVDSVLIDLTKIGGTPNQEMTKLKGVQPANRQWYGFETTIPNSISTGDKPVELPVEVRKGNETAKGVASVLVTADRLQSVAPKIDQAFFFPISVAPDGVTPVKISAQVSDSDGAETLTSVVANLGPLGLGFVPLTEVQGIGGGAETVSRYFESASFAVPKTTPTQTYQVVLTAQDATGEIGTLTIPFSVSSSLSGPSVDENKSYLAPRKSVPHDGVTTFSINVFVSDPDGLADIASVTADFGNLGLPPGILKRGADAADNARSGYFILEGLTIPRTTPTGVRQIPITVTDQAGSSANMILQIDVTEKDTVGEPPRILVDRSYTTPRVTVNDGSTPFTLHVFVRDDDDDVESVLVNLNNVGQVGTEKPADFGLKGAAPSAPSAAGGCPTSSSTLACLEPSLKEGKEGQWFILSDITVRSDVTPSSEPYLVDVVVTDKGGKTTRQSFPIRVNDASGFTNDAAPPQMLAAVATSKSTVEVVFNEELDATSISSAGREFTITLRNDVRQTLPVLSATINAAGTIVTLTTQDQAEGTEYVVEASKNVRDAVGVPLVAGAASRLFFTGFKASDKPPVVEYIAASDADKIEIEFRDPLKPSSLKLAPVTAEPAGLGGRRTAREFNIEIYESGETSGKLEIRGVEFLQASNALLITTAPQKPDQRYRVTIKDIESASGVKLSVPITKMIKGFKASALQQGALIRSADLNGDGKVDFIDFTMFSAVYGTTVGGAAPLVIPPSPPSGQPIPPTPDALVPITSPTP